MLTPYNQGLLYLLLVNLLWSISSLITQLMFTRSTFTSPYYLTAFVTGMFTVLIKGEEWRKLWRVIKGGEVCKNMRDTQIDGGYKGGVSTGGVSTDSNGGIPSVTIPDVDIQSDDSDLLLSSSTSPSLSLRILHLYTSTPEISVALYLAPIWFGTNYLYYTSLLYTTLTASTVLSTMSGPFTYLLEIFVNYYTTERNIESNITPPTPEAEEETWGDRVVKRVRKYGKLIGVVVTFTASAYVASLDRNKSNNDGGNQLDDDGDDFSSYNTTGGTEEGEKEEGVGGGEILGDLFGTLSAFGYAVYTVYIKRYITTSSSSNEDDEDGGGGFDSKGGEYEPVEERDSIDSCVEISEDTIPRTLFGKNKGYRERMATDMRLVLGYMGLINLLGLTVLTGILTAAGVVEGIDKLGITWSVLGGVTFVGLLDNVLSDLLWAKAVLMTSPTVATVALSLTVPMAVGGDVVMGREVGWERVGGAVGVVVGFLFVNL
ncbi:hypothetical protein TrCOL_g13431 [Triparma columacea]|uniref:EamA domain-containing protein n=1 Tax=Triparma columacea TaxID=722753 RepID=A0A9W7GBQ6_9STRA|nr:hypothetical protein TrCOL_g13431 [Triparma columacea]